MIASISGIVRAAPNLPIAAVMLEVASEHKRLIERVIGCGLTVHAHFGPGLLESVYRRCLVIELQSSGLKVENERRIPLTYKGVNLDCVFSPDLIVENVLVVELKAIEAIARVHHHQVITYLKLTGCPVGLLMNFNVPYLKEGLRRLLHPDIYKKE